MRIHICGHMARCMSVRLPVTRRYSVKTAIHILNVFFLSFRYASPRLWNQLPDSFRQPIQSCPDSCHSLVNPSLSSSPLSASITPLLIHFRIKTYLFNKSFLPSLYFVTHWTAFMIMGLNRIWTGLITLISLFLFSFFYIFCSFRVVD